MFDRRLMQFLLGRCVFEISSPTPPDELRVLLEKSVTPNVAHGFFKDWPNSKPFMGEVDNSGFSLLEKSRFGQGWPAKIDGKFDRTANDTIVSVFTYPTKPEKWLWYAVYLIASFFILLGIFANGRASDSMTFIDRAMAIGIPTFMIIGGRYDSNERAKRVKQALTQILQRSA